MLTDLDTMFTKAAAEGTVPGALALATNASETFYEGAFGSRRLGTDQKVEKDTVVLLASMSKPITATAVMQLVESGRVELDEPVEKWLPELANPQVIEGFDDSGKPVTRSASRPIRLRHLLTHTAGFSYEFFSEEVLKFKEASGTPGFGTSTLQSLKNPLLFDPGTRWEYGINIDWAGVLLQRVTDQSLGAYLSENVLGPLGMEDTRVVLRPDMEERLCSVHARTPDGGLTPLDFQLPQSPETEMGGQALYGTVSDCAQFLRMILNKGMSGGEQILKPETVEAMMTNQIGDLPVTGRKSVDKSISSNYPLAPDVAYRWSFAFMINQRALAIGRSAGSLAWSGLCNTYFWIDPTRNRAGVFATQILPFADVPTIDLFGGFEEHSYRSVS